MDTCCSIPSRPSSALEWKFIWALILNGALATSEVVMSVLTGSSALLADGLMNTDDAAALVFSIYTEKGSWYLFLLSCSVPCSNEQGGMPGGTMRASFLPARDKNISSFLQRSQ